ncbi:S41 family peptidase [Parabacteroides sp. Marseille-P3160]|uniref:S41 family peptidase n=1 Tax=Parabacteroides sp. Marseille-P3160 TaxID=1917887 RepID=UPI0009BA674B|nr:S41 family peptidase [Parabacteroides sp. Marseille-P3160]
MNIKFLLPILFAFYLIGCRQKDHDYSNFNLSFEKIQNGMPQNWEVYPSQQNYSIYLDSIIVKSGKYAIAIESTGDSITDHAITFNFPNKYEGKKITLSGYIKSENVDGYAGLLMAVGADKEIHIPNKNGVVGTTDWNKYELTLDLVHPLIQNIIIGGFLEGKGKIWLDDLKVTIDGQNIEKIQSYKPKPFPAKGDKEFDKGSNIIFPTLSEQKIEDLELLGRIWGFLKYHHPIIANGDYNIDYELFRILPSYLNSNDNKQRDKILLKWINKYGRIQKSNICRSIHDTAFVKPNLTWIERSNINLKLKKTLIKIYLNRNQGYHYYIELMPGVGNPYFSNERTYEAMDYPDAGFRLLALFRYWNIIYYFFPYKHLIDKDWNVIFKEYIPLFIKAKNRLEYELAASQLIGEICDSHAILLDGWIKVDSLRGKGQTPIVAQFIENRLVVTDYYFFYDEKVKSAALHKGDIITHIDGKPVELIVDSVKKYYSASNNVAKMRDIARDILRSNKPYIRINYISSGKIKQKEVIVGRRDRWIYYRNKGKDNDITPCYKFICKDIGYITLKNIKSKEISVIMQKFINTKGIIIDIRNYPHSFVPFLLGSYFVSDTTPFVKFTISNPENPGEFNYTPVLVIPKPERFYQGRLLVLVNEETHSQAEYTAMAFRAGDNTTIVGSQTSGADGNVSKIVLPGGLYTRISGIGVYYPDGSETQRFGIVPDIKIEPTIKGIREGRDELLEKAIEIIKQKR